MAVAPEASENTSPPRPSFGETLAVYLKRRVLIVMFLPSLGDSYQVLTFGARNGSFSNVDLSQAHLPSGEQWATTYDPNDFTLTVVAS